MRSRTRIEQLIADLVEQLKVVILLVFQLTDEFWVQTHEIGTMATDILKELIDDDAVAKITNSTYSDIEVTWCSTISIALTSRYRGTSNEYRLPQRTLTVPGYVLKMRSPN